MTSSSAFASVDSSILLEAGTNEAEILVFRVGNQRFGVNVAKVREVLPIEAVTPIPNSHPAVDGLVTIRELVVPLVNLSTYFHKPSNEDDITECSLLLLEFNRQHVAFRVDTVDRIFRVSWKDTLPAIDLGGETSPITSIWRASSELVPLVDFEAITTIIGIGGKNTCFGSVSRKDSDLREQYPILFADDSTLINEMVKDSLNNAGFTNTKGFGDGDELWRYVDSLTRSLTPEEVKQQIACIVTDIEMPRMDGLSLTKIIRNNSSTADIPVVVYSSLASEDNKKKGEQVGATAQVPKPHYDELVNTVVEVIESGS